MYRKSFKTVIAAVVVTALSVTAGSFASAGATAPKTDETKALVNDFETIADLYDLYWYGFFGKADLNSDQKFVTSGTHSMKVNPIGDYKVGSNPTYLSLPLNKLKTHEASRVKTASFDVFNASASDAVVSAALALDESNTPWKDFTIKKGEKREIKLTFDTLAMSAAFDINKIEGVFVKFPKAVRGKEDENIFYIDNFRAEFSPLKAGGYEMSFTDDFCSFDEPWQEFIANTDCGTGAIDGYRPELIVNTDPFYCADKNSENFIFGKNKSLKVVAKCGLTFGRPGFTFNDKLWHGYEWDKMDDKALVFDAYNDTDSDFTFSFTIFRDPDNYDAAYYDRYVKGFVIPAYGWARVVLPIKEWNDATKNTSKEPLKSEIRYGKTVYNYQTPFFSYSAANVVGKDKVFYFDNFRIEDYSENNAKGE